MLNKKTIPTMIASCLIAVCLFSSCDEEYQVVDYDYLNGQTMTFVPSHMANVDSVQYYLDDVLIDTQKKMPFVLVFKIQDQTPGVHYFKYAVYYQHSTHSITTTITIK